jgi:hypothetical protein
VLRAGGREPSGFDIPTKPTGDRAPAGQIRVALGPQGEARLLLPLEEKEDPTGIVGAPALDIRVSHLEEQLRTRRFLDLECRARDLEVVFAKVVAQIIERIVGGASCTDAVRSTIDEFRALLTSKAAQDAPREKVAGLVGELLLLNDLLARSPEGWRAWRGPEGARHDFTLGAVAFEVKVSMAKGRSKITINGLEQLCEPSGGELFLQHYELEAAANGPLSIRSLGKAALRRASEPAHIEALVATLGCPSVEDDAWNGIAFRLEGDRVYRVDEQFPRLIGTAMSGGKAPAGISDVSYCVDLASASGNQLDQIRSAEAKGKLIP